MRVALYGDALVRQNAGVFYYTLDLYNKLVQHYPDHEYFLILPEEFGKISNCEEIIIPISRYIPFHQRIRQFIQIPRKVNRLKVDFAIEPAHFGPFFLKKSIKKLTVIHDLTPIKHSRYHKFLDVIMHKLLLKGIIKRADLIVTNSHTTELDVHEYVDSSRDKTQIVYPGLVKKEIHNSSLPPNLGIRNKYILSVGTLEPRKNHLSLIKAFELYHKTDKECLLVITGKKGWKNEAVDEYLHNNEISNHIIFTGYVERNILWALYKHASLFVYASHYEGFGLPVMEAMSEGIPCLISKVPSLVELANDAAIFFDPDDVDEIYNQIHDILINDELRDSLSKQALNRYQYLMEKSLVSLKELGSKIGLA